MRAITVAAVLLATSAGAKSWQGVEPGQTKKAEVLDKFGEPSRVMNSEGKELIGYLDAKAIRGTRQVQFTVDPATQHVERIVVFPGPLIDKESVESTYGPLCPSGRVPASLVCYQKKITEDFRTYFVYARLGLVVFLNEDGKTVQSFLFTPQGGK